MRPIRLRPLAAALLCLALLACQRTPQLSPLPADGVVLAFGDSLTAGTGAPAGQSYPELLAGLIGRSVINAGVPGEVTAAGLARLPGLLEQHRPRLLLLCHGGNDMLRRTGLEQAAANLRSMIELAQQQGTEVLLIGVPQPGLLLSPPDFYAKLAEEFRLPYLDETLPDILSERQLKSDTVHPNGAGYRQLAEALVELLRRAGAV